MNFPDEPYKKTIGVSYNLYQKALSFTLEMGEISSPMLQRKFGIPYHISAMLMDLLELNNVINKNQNPGGRRKVEKIN